MTLALRWGGWSAPRPGRFTPRERPGTYCTGGWVGPRAGLDGCGKYRPPTGIRSPDRPARSESLYRLSYPGPVLKKKKARKFENCVTVINAMMNEPDVY